MIATDEEKKQKRRDYQRQRRMNPSVRSKEREYHKKYYKRNDVKERKKKYNQDYYSDKSRGKKHRNYCCFSLLVARHLFFLKMMEFCEIPGFL